MTTIAVESNTEPVATKESENEVDAFQKFDIVGHLPVEIIQQILFDLPPEDLHSATLCCSRWSAAVSDDYFWKRLCEREGHLEVEESERSEFYNNFLTKYNYWQGVYWYNYTLQRNWETNNYREDICEIKQFTHIDWWNFGDVIAFSELDDDGLNMHIYDLRKEELKPTVFPIRDAKGDPVNLLRSGNYLVYLIYRESISIWDFVNETIIVEDDEWNHGADVEIDKNLLIVIPRFTRKFEVFNIETNEITYKYKGDFKNLILKDGKVIFSTNNVINVVKCHDKSIVPLTCCQSAYIRHLLVKNDVLLSVCKNSSNCIKTLCIWNTTTNTKLHSILLGLLPNLIGISLIDKYFCVTRYNDAEKNYVIEFWNYMKETSEVAIIASINQYIYSSSNDHFMVSCDCLNIWCLRTRNFIPILNTTPPDDDDPEVELFKTKLICVIRPVKEFYDSITTTIHRRNYEV